MPTVNVGILAVGSELLGTDRVDTNSLRLTESLLAAGCFLARKSVVGDDHSRLCAELQSLIRDCDLVLVTGGLGPTRDDLTREALAVASGRPLERDTELERELEERFSRMGRKLSSVNLKQADRPQGAIALHNARGTAPGLRLDLADCTIFLFPGVPHELQGLIETDLSPWLANRGDAEQQMSQIEVHVAALPESVVEERIAPVYDAFGVDHVSVLASPGEVKVRVRVHGGAARSLLADAKSQILECVGSLAYDEGHDASLEASVGQLLITSAATVAVAESCTGGLVGQRLTGVAGSSSYFAGGTIAYGNEIKERELGVAPSLLQEFGAVSRPVAVAMAEGARDRFRTSHALAVTGVAGPGGGSPEKPVGTVHLAVAGPLGTSHNRARFPGGRETVRQLSSQVVLVMLRAMLRGETVDPQISGGWDPES